MGLGIGGEEDKLRILDLGCGDQKLPGAIEVDLDPKATEADIIADMEDMRAEVKDCVADRVVMFHSLEHVNVLRALREAHRVLKPGGTIYIETPNAYNAALIVRLLLRNRYDVCEDHIQTFGVVELSNALSRAGFAAIKSGCKDYDVRFLSYAGFSNKLGRLISRLLPQFGEVLWVEARKT